MSCCTKAYLQLGVTGVVLFSSYAIEGATVRALGHITALTVYSKNNPPGEKPTIVKVQGEIIVN